MPVNNPNIIGGIPPFPAGSASVVGIASPTSTDNAIARFDGTTGTLLQNSAVTVADTTGAIAGCQSITGGAANMTIVSGTGASRTMTLQTTTGAGTATNAIVIGATQNVNISTGELQTAGARVGYNVSAYGAGSAYAFTNTAAAIDFGTTDPAVVIANAGTYLIYGQVAVAYTGATVAAETATLKVRRTNNTAADLSAVVVIDLPVATTLTHTYGTVTIPPFVYTTSATDDAVTLFANVSAALGAGTIDATAVGTSILVVRLY